jgi:hypothetical protein
MSRCQVAGGLMILNAEAVAAGQASQQIIIRTRFWDEALLDAQDNDLSQVVILAAGMDARAYRLPWRAGTTVYEVDQPQVIAAKDERLAGERPRCRRVAVDIELADGWPKALQSQGFSPSARRCGWLRGCCSTSMHRLLTPWGVGHNVGGQPLRFLHDAGRAVEPDAAGHYACAGLDQCVGSDGARTDDRARLEARGPTGRAQVCAATSGSALRGAPGICPAGCAQPR